MRGRDDRHADPGVAGGSWAWRNIGLIYAAGVVLVLAAIGFGAMLAACDNGNLLRCMAVDSCLDAGGSWNHETEMCRKD